MPNLRAIIETAVDNENKFAPNLELHHSLVYILFGLVDDGPGMIWIPGKGPVPVDPDWGVFVRTIPAPKRDLFAALAMNELAGLIEDQPDRTRLADASIDAMRGAVDRISRMR